MRKTCTLLCAILAVLVATSGAGANITQNGSFELGTDPGGSFITLNDGSTAITDWTVIGGVTLAVDYIGGYWTASDGRRSLDLNGNPGPGGVEQTGIPTVIGTSYLVTFDMAGNPDGQPDIKTLEVSAVGVGTMSKSFSFDASNTTKSNMGWQQQQWRFTADSASTTLRFMSTTTNSPYGPALDNVSMTVVPAPGAVLLGSLGVGLIGWLRRRRAL